MTQKAPTADEKPEGPGNPEKSEEIEKPKKSKKFAPSSRPNYNLIHKDPLPITIEPLPPLIPHNPLSILAIVWAWLRSTYWRSAPGPAFSGVFSPLTNSVHITDPKTIRALWEAGFFGKGTLSRSEPTWLDREKRRRGLKASETSEEITRKRRLERKQFKEGRALKEREQIEATLKQERLRNAASGLAPEARDSTEEFFPVNAANQANGSIDATTIADKATSIELERPVKQNGFKVEAETMAVEGEEDVVIEDLEHLQLTSEEAFFLAFGLGVLKVLQPSPLKPGSYETIATRELFSLFRAHSTFPPKLPAPVTISPSDTFVANYAVYHHFRSLGWCIRPGPKFAVDWMLYNRGPAFSHAEFAVLTMPSYSHAYWKSDEGVKALQQAGIKSETKSWHWLHMVNRVQTQVRKTLVLAYVEMPPPLENDCDVHEDAASVLKRMKVREIVFKRWSPNRNRD